MPLRVITPLEIKAPNLVKGMRLKGRRVLSNVRSFEDIRLALRAGADKVCLNTAVVRRPELRSRESKINLRGHVPRAWLRLS